MDTAQNAGDVLRELRGKKSRQFVADALGVSLSAYTKYERGERTPRDDLKRRIAKFYNSSVESIFFCSNSSQK